LTLPPNKWAIIEVDNGLQARVLNVNPENLSEDQIYLAFVGAKLVFIENANGCWKVK
jgi:hypothetical protein